MALAIAAVWYKPFLHYTPYDYSRWLGPWYRHILDVGPASAFSEPFGNYTPPYLYLLSAATLLDRIVPPLISIKILSTAGALWLAFAVFLLQRSAGAPRPTEGAVAALLLPTVFFNVPVLAQADCFWVAPSILAVAAALKQDERAMTIWAGVAVSIKVQAIFLAPFVLAVLVRRRSPPWYWIIPMFVYAAAMLPAWFAGWPASDLATVYIRQANWVPANGIPFISNAGNWWMIFKLFAFTTALHSFWIGYLLAAAAAIMFIFYFARRQGSQNDLILSAAISSTMLPWLLPGMHERFFALAEILTFCLAWTSRDARSLIIALLMQVGLCLAMFGWLLDQPGWAVGSVAPVTGALYFMLRESVSASRVGKLHPEAVSH
jgi:Gpi18-like mannosyltransferase